MSCETTIYGISSGVGRAGIAVVRVSGAGSADVLKRMAGCLPPARRFAFRQIFDPSAGELLDQGVVVWLPGPATATGEDMAELHLHGSAAVVDGVIEALARMPGLRLAEPGEFSRRAFRNGKMDLVEAEGLADLLAAAGDGQRQQALYHMAGGASRVIGDWSDEAVSILARVEASLDFIDEPDVASLALQGVRPRIEKLARDLGMALEAAVRSDAVREGVRVVIAGPPNVGKSSLLNALAARDAAIVSPLPGTTRDAVEVRLMLGGLPVTVTDTAGLRQDACDAVEEMGMARTLRAAFGAHVLLLVSAPDVPVSRPEILSDAITIHIRNKIDLDTPHSIHKRNESEIGVSALSGHGVAELVRLLEEAVRVEFAVQEAPVLVRERHKAAVTESIRLLNESLSHGPEQLELTAECLRGAAHSLGRLTGRVDVEDLLGRIFSEFCVGK